VAVKAGKGGRWTGSMVAPFVEGKDLAGGAPSPG